MPDIYIVVQVDSQDMGNKDNPNYQKLVSIHPDEDNAHDTAKQCASLCRSNPDNYDETESYIGPLFTVISGEVGFDDDEEA